MHLRISVLLLFNLLTRGFCLECYNCGGDPNCKEKMTCDSEKTRCGSSIGGNYSAGRKMRDSNTRRSCIDPRECRSWSVTTFYLRQEATVHCCDTDLCNGALPDMKRNLEPNGKVCYSCTWDDCIKPIKCRGNEHYCITAHGPSSVIYKGCASDLPCEIQGMVYGPRTNVTCCEGNLCNAQ